MPRTLFPLVNSSHVPSIDTIFASVPNRRQPGDYYLITGGTGSLGKVLLRQSRLTSRLYRNGKRAGTQYNWWEDGKVKSYYNYTDDLLDGPAEEHFKNGNSYRKMNYTMGYEKGMQQILSGKRLND